MVATYFAGTLPDDPFFEENEDLMVLQEALLEVYSDEEPIDYGDSPLDVGASGTALRFVTAVCASSPGADYVVTGTPRLMERPMDPLVDLLREAGAGVICLGQNNCGPYKVTGKELEGGEFTIRGDISSQFISALMLVAPSWKKGIKLNFSTPPVSRPYIEMTARLMEKFGIKPSLDEKGVTVPPGKYVEPGHFHVEADWSSASFFYEACALGAKDIKIADLPSPEDSLQGDAVCASLFEKLGVVSKFGKNQAVLDLASSGNEYIEADFKDCPDLLLPFALACLLRGVKFKAVNVAHLRLKESDRLESLRLETAKLGYIVKVEDNVLYWEGETSDMVTDPVIDTYDDHRVAMSFAMTAFKYGIIRIAHPRVVEKSFVDFWNQLPGIGLTCNEENDVMTVRFNQESRQDMVEK